MARPRTFDEDQVIDRAVQVFRRSGYAGTSISDLVAALGIERGSIYAAFGSKSGLYHRALERYRLDGLEQLDAALDAAPVLPALRDALIALATDGCDDPSAACLVVSATTERHDVATTAQVRDQHQRLSRTLQTALARAIALGELTSDADVERLAAFLVTFVQGVRVMASADSHLDDLRRSVDVALTALPRP